MAGEASATLSVREAAELLGRDHTRVYALVRSGDLVAVPNADGRALQVVPAVPNLNTAPERFLADTRQRYAQDLAPLLARVGARKP